MKFMNLKKLIPSCAICLLMIFPGVILWDKLPDLMPVHFNINNEPDNFVSKGIAVFGIPIFMTILLILCCFISTSKVKIEERKKFESSTIWIVPAMTAIMQSVTIAYSLGYNVDIRRCAVLIIGCTIIITGIYMTKSDSADDFDIGIEKERKANHFTGIEMIVIGILLLLTIFLPPIATFVWIFLLIPYVLITAVYKSKRAKENSD